MKATSLFVFRHGETDWNQVKRFQGHTDIPLNANGLKQAEELAHRLAPLSPDLIVSSDLLRAKVTAEIVNKDLGVELKTTALLRECRIGAPEGMLREEIIQNFGESSWERWTSVRPEDLDFGYPEGESKREHLKRMVSYLEDLCLNHKDYNKIAVSTHGASMRRLIHFCEGAPKDPVPIPNCALYHIEFHHDSKTWIYKGPLLSNQSDFKGNHLKYF